MTGASPHASHPLPGPTHASPQVDPTPQRGRSQASGRRRRRTAPSTQQDEIQSDTPLALTARELVVTCSCTFLQTLRA